MLSKQSIKLSLFIVFAISGFSGLIYESIWTHYLKLVLGHAAYSQTLVLLIFMGGMAIGAWLISKKSSQISRPILAYAIIELIIGFLGIYFHQIFITSQSFLYNDILPNIQSSDTANTIRWVWAALLILPQSILLGATFPLMSAGIIRLFPKTTGSILSMLYFSNSIGAAIGVLVSGFVLIEMFGLPGTILTAGSLNILLALLVWTITKSINPSNTVQTSPGKTNDITNASYPFTRILLVATFFTGLASFFYEIGWIRMLNLVLGTTTQSFELMLSAFITGIAFGGLWIRKHIDKIDNVLHFTGYVQIIMGLLAISTLVLYNSTFDFMAFMLNALHNNESGYKLFISSSHLIAFVIMVPTTFMAGMTLPLFTFSYMKAGYGERGIGRIYAANTLGSITGIFLAVHLVLPVLGLQNLISLGALVDIILGITLLYLANKKNITLKLKVVFAASISVFMLVAVLAEFDKGKMASGVYRDGGLLEQAKNIVFHKDGKTSTIDVSERRGNENELLSVSIRTNGKSDASANFGKQPPSFDEPTMVLIATYPLATYPEAKTAAVIGLGSGITTHTLLQTNKLTTVDTIEIESAMVEGARYFREHSELVYTDPRSHIHIDDAKSFFSVNNKRYDLILSEPSNPWVSGVASLFTEEFYSQLKPHLNQGGIFVQWLQVYETDIDILASVFKAINDKFKYYVVYSTVNTDIVIMASDDDKILKFKPWIFEQKPLNNSLTKIGIKNLSDLYSRRVGTKNTLEPFFLNTFGTQANSDYFPYISKHAPKARFMKSNATAFTEMPHMILPIMDLIDPLPEGSSRFNTTTSVTSNISLQEKVTHDIYEHIINNSTLNTNAISPSLNLAIKDVQLFAKSCVIMSTISDSFIEISKAINVFLPPAKANNFWKHLTTNTCYKKLDASSKLWLSLLESVARQNPEDILSSIKPFMDKGINTNNFNINQITYFYVSGLSAYITNKNFTGAINFVNKMPAIYTGDITMPLNIRLLIGIITSNQQASH